MKQSSFELTDESPRTIGDWVRERAAKYGDKHALTCTTCIAPTARSTSSATGWRPGWPPSGSGSARTRPR